MQRRLCRGALSRALGVLVLGAGLGIAGVGSAAASPNTAIAVTTLPPILPSSTGSGIQDGPAGDDHYVAFPADVRDRKNVAVLFIGGALGTADHYEDITGAAAALGYDAVDLAYENAKLIADSCLLNKQCYGNFRGETIFGAGVVYDAQVGRSWESSATDVTGPDSIVGRTVSVLDSLEAGDAAHWSRYLVDDLTSPYSTRHHAHVRPNWAKIVVAGHSQGGGHATFIGQRIPVRRVVTFSGPQDTVLKKPVDWVLDPTATPLSKMWGLRNSDEGIYGNFVSTNWADLGGVAGPGLGGTGHNGEVNVGDGSGSPGPSAQRLVLTGLGSSDLDRHYSTAVDADPGTDEPQLWSHRSTAWATLFTARGTD